MITYLHFVTEYATKLLCISAIQPSSKKNLPASTSTYVFDQRNWSVILVVKVILGRDLWSVKNTAALNARVVKGY